MIAVRKRMGQMPYVIAFYRDSYSMGLKPWPGDLETAKEYAINYLLVHNATRAAVIDEHTRKLVFAYPDGTGASEN